MRTRRTKKSRAKGAQSNLPLCALCPLWLNYLSPRILFIFLAACARTGDDDVQALLGSRHCLRWRPRTVLEEAGQPYEMIKLDTAAKEHEQPAYKTLTPTAASRRSSTAAS